MNQETIYALISEEVYSRSSQNAGLNISGLTGAVFLSSLDSGTGLYVEAWSVGGKVVVAFRGTDFNAPNSSDWTQGNLPLALGNPQAGQFQAAITFVESLGSLANVVFTGHSLGGGLAGLMAAKYGKDAYVFAPAPFKATSDAPTFFPVGLSTANANLLLAGKPVIPVNGDGIPQPNDPDYLQALAAYDAAKAARDSLVNANYPKIHSYGLTDEVLQKFTQTGPLSFAAGLAGVSHFDPTPDVTFTVGGAFGITESLAKHSMSLHALLMRTDSSTNSSEANWTNKPIGGANGLFTKDAALRDSFLITPGIAGLLNQPTRDNTSTGPDSGIMLRALISDLNFYTQFYTRFGTWLSTGAVALGKVTDSTDELSIHSGVVKLGLQVVRDSLTRSSTGQVVGDKGLNVFGAGNANGPTASYVRVDVADITATDSREKDPASNGKAFGIRDINYVIAKSVSDSLVTATHDAIQQSLLTKQLIGVTPGEVKSGVAFPNWSTLIVQAGTNPLTYDAKATGVTADANQSHVIFGGSVDGDNVKGSTVKDYFIGGDGKDTYESGGGNDLFVGGIGEDKFVARVGNTATDGVIFLGGPDKDTAVYGSDFDSINLTITASRFAAYSNQAGANIGYGSRVDQLIGVDRLEVGKGNNTATFTDAAQKLGMTVAFAGGKATFLRIHDQLDPAPEAIQPVKGTATRIEFATAGATVAQQQTLSTAADFEQAERPNALIFVNGHQLTGGATFDFDKFDLVSNGNVKPIYLMNSSQSYPVVATDDRVHTWLSDQVDVATKYLGGLTGNVPGVNGVSMGPLLGLTFAPILFGELGKFAASWNTGYIQTIVGGYGERYDLSSLAADGTRTVTITLNPLTDGLNQTIVINNWKQGDYGIQIKQLGFGQGLDSGTNKNGQLETWQGVSLDTVRARLAEVGIVAPAPQNQTFARSANDDDQTPLVRAGNSDNNDLAGGGGSDLLRGYQGDDDLLGGEGRDTYVFAVGDGHDVIEDLSPEGAVIRFLDGLDVSTISKQLVAGDPGVDDLLISYGSGDTILIKGWSALSAEEQLLWTFESVTAKLTPINSADEPDISVVPEAVGGTAKTIIVGTAGADVLAGIDIDEQIDGQGGNDVITGGGGADDISGGDGDDDLDGGGGDDIVRGGDGNDLLKGGDGNDAILNDAGDDIIIGGRGDDHIVINNLTNGNDTYIFNRGDGKDIIESAMNTDTLKLGPGILPSDIIIERPVFGTDTGSNLYGDLVIRIAGTQDQVTFRNAFVYSFIGNDPTADMDSMGPLKIVFDNGVVWSRDDLLKYYISHAGSSGNDTILGSPADEVIVGGAGNDIFYANEGNDGYVWNRGDGNDRIASNDFERTDDITRIVFGTGIAASDISFQMNAQGQLVVTVAGANGGSITVESYFAAAGGNLGLDRISFTDGTVWTRTDIDQRYLAPLSTGGDDVIIGTAGADIISGGTGNDTLIGNGGADILDGGAGNDTLFGNGQVTYQFGSSFGQDVVRDMTFFVPSYPTPDGDSHRDRLAFSSYNLADFSISWSAPGTYDLILSRLGSTDKVTIQNYRDLYDVNLASIENFAFQDGTLLAFNQINAIANRTQTATNTINGTAAAETLTGTAAGDNIIAYAGADIVHGNDGDDLINAGDGDDLVTGDAGDDILLGGAGIDTIGGGIGNDIIYAGAGNDIVTGDAGADILYGESGDDQLNGGADNDILYGHAGNDTLSGGTGDDRLVGGAGNDTYVFNRGDGHDIVQVATERASGEIETLVLGGGITQGDVHFGLSGRDLVISFTVNPADQITVKDFLGAGVLSSIVIGGVTLTATQILDTLTGATSGAGNATPVAAGGGTSLVYGGRGNDTLTGDDQGNTYVFLKGDGQDRLDSPRPFFHSGTDDLVLDGYAPAEAKLARAGSGGLDLGITFTSGTDRIDVTGQFGNGFQGIDSIQFEDGTVWSVADIKARVMSQAGTVGSDNIVGFDDTDDIVKGGTGNDTLAGGTGNDHYVFNTGDGQDSVVDSGGSNDRLELGAGMRVGNTVVTRSAVDANDAILTFSATDIVTLKGVFADATSGVDKVVFADGTVWSKTDFANAFLAGKTTAGADAITGTVSGDTIAGGLGNDTLTGGAGGDTYLFNRGDGQDTVVELATDGNDRLQLGSGIATSQVTLRKGSVDPTDLVVDIGSGETVTIKAQLAGGTAGVEAIAFADGTVWGRVDFDQKLLALTQTAGADTIVGSTVSDRITGGTGNDTIDGRDGADIYVFNRGDGQDTIADTGTGAGLDRIEFGTGIGFADIDLSHGTNPNDLIIAIRGTADRITVQNHFVSGSAKIGMIVLPDGTALFAADILALANNHAPTVQTAIGTKTVAQNGTFNFAVPANTFVDSDGDTLSFKATQVNGSALPGWLHFDGSVFTGTPANSDVGTPIQVRLSAFDAAGDSVNNDFTINVTNVNDAPVLATLITNKTATVGSAFSFQFAANQFTDPDGQTLTYTATLGSGAPLPSWLTFNASTRTFSGTPATANRGAVDVVITASDGTASTTTHFGIFVGTTGNTTPTVGTAMSLQNATEDLAFSYQVPVNAFNDTTAGDRLRYTAKLSSGAAIPTWLTLDPVTGLFTGKPANGDVGQITVRVTATDIFGATAAANFTLKVNNVNDAPTASGQLESFATNEDSLFTYTIPQGFFSDVDAGDGLTLVAFLPGGSPLPDWLSFNPTTRTLSGTPDGKDVGMLKVSIVAFDHSNEFVQRDMFILVNPVNDAPVVSHPLDAVAVDRGDFFTFAVPADTFSDDGMGVSLKARMADGTDLPSWLSFDAGARVFAGVPDDFSVGDNEGVHIYRIALTATDAQGAATTTFLNLAIRGPNPGTLVLGTEGNDTLTGSVGPDTIYGLGGDDQLQGRDGIDTYVFDRGFGHDTITSRYVGEGGLEFVTSGDVVSFGAGIAASDVSVQFGNSFPGNNIFYESHDPTIITDFYQDDVILTVGSTGDSVRIATQLINDRFSNFAHTIEQVRFADGTVWSGADITNRLATGTAGNDMLVGDFSANLLSGGAGNDRLLGQEGDDTLIGGAGNDDLYGDVGSDTYVFNLGDGRDRLIDSSNLFGVAGSNTLRFGAGIRATDLVFTRDTRDPYSFSLPPDAGSLLIEIAGTSDSIKIYHQYNIHNNISMGVDSFVFDDGTILSRAQIDQMISSSITGTDAAETLTGTAADELINGKKGADLLRGMDGNDTYLWNLGDGNDTISEIGLTGFDVLKFGAGIRPQDITLSRQDTMADESNHLFMTIAPTGEKLKIEYEFYFPQGQTYFDIEEFRFADGTVWTAESIMAGILASTSGNDSILGFDNHADVMDGGAGNDVLNGKSGGDTYVFGRGYGSDTIIDQPDGIFGNIVDKIQFNATVSSTDVTLSRVGHVDASNFRIIDTIFSINGTTDKLIVAGAQFGFDGDSFTSISFGGDLQSWSGSSLGARYLAQNSTSGDDSVLGFAANETISTGLGNDSLDGGRGNDILIGGAGNDTYTFWRAPGDIKTIRDAGTVSDVDTLNLGPGILTSEVTIFKAANENDLIVKINGGSDGQIVLEGRLIGAEYSADQIRFADNTLWNYAAITTRVQAAPADAHLVNGTAAAETITGTGLAETFDSKAGNDTIVGGGGDDIYIYHTGDGNDIIDEDYTNSDTDTLKLRDFTASQIVLQRSNNDLVVHVKSTGADITVKNQFAATSYGVEEIVFSDRTVYNRAAIAANVDTAPYGASFNGSITEGDPNGAYVGTVFGFDFDFPETLTYSLTDSAGGRFAINTANGQVTVANSSLIDYETATAHAITVRITDHAGLFLDKTFAVFVNDADESVNRAPNAATLTGGSVAEKALNGVVVGTVLGSDPDAGATLTYALLDNAGGRFAINATTGQITVANGTLLDYETATSHGVTVRVTDQGGLTFDKAFNLNVTNVNEAPSDATLTGGTVAESSANGTAVGTVTGVDPDAGATLTYSLTNNAGGRFAINATTGLITVANGTLLDYETATSHSVTVRVTDQGGLTFDKAFTIALTDVDETANHAPTNATLTGGSFAENVANGTVVGTIAGTDPDAGATLTYSLTDSAGGRFAINATTGQITVANTALVDYETATSHSVTVRVTDQGGLTFDKAFTLTVTNVNEAPSNATLTGGTIAENSANGATVGTVAGVDLDAGATMTYSLTDSAGGRFAINATTGLITVANGTLLNFESAASHNITVRVTDQAGLTFDKAFAVAVTNVNEAPSNATLTGGTIAENSANGATVGTVAGVDPDAGATLTYSLTDNAGGRFAVNATTGLITVANGTLLNFESAASHNITVRVTDQGGLTFDKVFAVGVTNVNEAPGNATLTGGTIAENSANGATVGTVAGVDPDAGATLTYSLTDNAGGRFAINATTGVITVANGTLLNFESAASHNITVRVTDQGGLTFDKVFAVGVTNVNEAPNNATLTGGTIAENSANGATVGTVAGVDPDAGATMTYSLTDNAGGRFAINATTGVVTVANGTLLNFESAASHNITVRVTDQGGLTFDKVFSLTVTNLNEAPSNATLTGGTIAENSANGATVGTVAGVDPDAGATMTYSLTDTAGGRFAINATTGVVTVANGTLLNFESAASHNITVRVTDQGGLTFDKVLAIGVTNVNEAPSNATLTGSTIAENSANGATVGTVAGVDPDAGATLTYSLTDTAGGRFAINATTGKITVANGTLLDFETATSHNVSVHIVDQGGLVFDKVFTLSVTNVAGTTQNGTSAANTLTGGNEEDILNGLAGNDTLNGLGGNDTLDGGAGNDTMKGGTGNDIYIVDSASDIVTENANEGIDEVRTALTSYTIGANVENLTGTGTAAFTGTGNTLDNVLTGGSGNDTLNGLAGNDTLNGGLGNDTMKGGTGNDIYIVNATGDIVTENASEGTDEVRTALTSYTLGSNVENLTGTGTAAFTGTGNTLDNVLIGGSGNDTLTGLAGNDTLNGMGGNDTMKGGVGNDIYIVDSTSDIVTENLNEGTDEVQTLLSAYTLAANVENLTGTVATGFTGDGNALDNIITGGSGNDVLFGEAGNDTLRGGAGDDVLQGGEGNDIFDGQGGTNWITSGNGLDTFIFNAGSGNLQVDDFSDGNDKIDMRGTGVTAANAAQNVTITEFAEGGVLVQYGASQVWLENIMPGHITFANDFILN